MAKRIDMAGWKMWEHGVPDSRLTVLSVSNCHAADGSIKWMCRCSCGNICEVSSYHLRNGHTLSCGCYQKDATSKSHKKKNTYDLSGGVWYRL